MLLELALIHLDHIPNQLRFGSYSEALQLRDA
jgi:hypothetical protein